MSQRIVMKIGEATVFAREGQFTDAMPEIVIGSIDGPVGQAFAQMGQRGGAGQVRARQMQIAHRRGDMAMSEQVLEGRQIDARFKSGVLTLTLPKKPEARAKRRKIEVKAG